MRSLLSVIPSLPSALQTCGSSLSLGLSGQVHCDSGCPCLDPAAGPDWLLVTRQALRMERE